MRSIRRWTVLLFLTDVPCARGDDLRWNHLYTKDGIAAYRAEGSASIPRFKADGRIDGNLYEVLAVMNDIPRRLEWVDNLKEIRQVSGLPEEQFRVYSLLDLPWPLADRDSIIDATVGIDYAKQEVLIDFQSVVDPAVLPRQGIIRVPHTRGLTRLKLLDENTIAVTYEIEFDSGGALPDWVVKLFSQDVPLKTIQALKKQVKKTRGRYDEFVKRHKEKAAHEQAKALMNP